MSAPVNTELALDIREIHKTFRGKFTVYNGLNIQVPKGQVVFILGPSGVGKSVMLKHTLGLLKPDSGEIFIFGKKIPYDDDRALNEMRKTFGMLFQSSALFDDFTVFQNVAFPLVEHKKGITFEEIRTKVEGTLKSVGLDPVQTLDKLPSELSGGMKKRVALARAIILEPQILLYDEPTTGLDPVTRSMVDDLILETNKKYGLTSIVISHDILSALYSADKIGFLFGGKIVFWGTPEEFQKCDHPMAKSFLDAEKRHKSVVKGEK